MKTLSSTIRGYIYRLVSVLDMGKKGSNDIIILCYHSIAKDQWRFSETFSTLKKQIDHILTVRKPISLEDLEMYLQGKKTLSSPSFIITFDDGYKNILQTIEYFQEKNIQPALFILSNPERANRTELNNNLPFLTISEIKTLKKAGWTIGVHSATHADFSALDMNSLQYEIKDSKTELEQKLSFSLPYFSYPKGVYTDAIVTMIKKSGYSMAVSMDDGFISTKTNPYILPRIGVDATHSFAEFKVLFSPAVIRLRGFLKQTPIANYFKS